METLATRYQKTISTLAEYAAGQIEYEERTGEFKARLSNKNRIIGSLIITNVLLACGVASLAGRNRIQPYVAVVDKDLRVLALGQAVRGNNSLAESVKRDQLVTWIRETRMVLKDFNAQVYFIKDSIFKTRDPATQSIRDWYDAHKPTERAKNGSVVIENISVVPIPGSSSYQAQWTERLSVENSGEVREEKWTGIFKVEIYPATSDDEAYKNATGFHVEDFQWSKA